MSRRASVLNSTAAASIAALGSTALMRPIQRPCSIGVRAKRGIGFGLRVLSLENFMPVLLAGWSGARQQPHPRIRILPSWPLAHVGTIPPAGGVFRRPLRRSAYNSGSSARSRARQLFVSERRPSASPRCKRIPIHLTFGELGQHSIGLLFLFEALVQKLLVIAQIQLTGQTRSRAISGDLVMLDFLC